MSITEIQTKIEGLSLDERRQLTAFLVSLRHKELAGYRERLSGKIDCQEESKWVSFEEFDKRISA